MKNREYIAALLDDENYIDDGGASYESVVYYHIDCPYYSGDKRAHCRGKGHEMTREQCTACKMEWLEMEVDE